MSNPEIDEQAGVETTGHEWDGIKELNNPLPRWWLGVLYLSIAVAVVYWILMPAWPGLKGYTPGILKQSDRAEVAEQIGALQVQRGRGEAMLATASLQQIESDPDLQAHALAVGQSVFGDNCATCHGAGGGGARAIPICATMSGCGAARWRKSSTPCASGFARPIRKPAPRRCRPSVATACSTLPRFPT